MKKLTCLLLSFLIFVSPILAQNPCEDSTYLELKKKKLDGLWTMWYENGQKEYEQTWKDGEMISEKCWDEDGNKCECGYYGCK
jgi:hypothetical protein|tara:strand:+ start:416 stop:664 length:249 start_codon:yes stop_codon:yes gene_type:complete